MVVFESSVGFVGLSEYLGLSKVVDKFPVLSTETHTFSNFVHKSKSFCYPFILSKLFHTEKVFF